MLTVVDAGGQAALLAPTEVLAQQHHRSITQMMGDLAEGGLLGGHANGTRVRLLTGSQSTAARKQALLDAASGDAGIVIGTHALLQERVEFFDLGLVVVDEQHRFGVEQRDALRAKADRPPHLLVMTATPIPRTVAMTVFGDLATSTLRELPAGRQPIVTHVVPAGDERWVRRSWRRVREEVDKGHQVYVVCPRIGGDFAAEDTMLAELEADLADGRLAGRGRSRAAGRRRPQAAAALGGRSGHPRPAARRPRPGRGADRGAARPAARRRQGGRDARLRRRRDRRAGRHHRGGGRCRRRERYDDGGPGRRPIRRLPAAPAARPGRPGHGTWAVPAGERRRARSRPRGSG